MARLFRILPVAGMAVLMVALTGCTTISSDTAVSADELVGFDGFFSEPWPPDDLNAFAVHVCGHGDIDDEVPLSDLASSEGVSLRAPGGPFIIEMVYGDSPSTVQAAYDDLTGSLAGCIENPERWDQGLNHDPDADPATWTWSQELSYIDSVASDADDKRFAFSYSLMDDDQEFCHHRMAIVLSGSRLAVIESTEMRGDRTIADSEFADIVDQAAELLTS